MISLVFPGQGSQKVGMGLEFYNKYRTALQGVEPNYDSLPLLNKCKREHGNICQEDCNAYH